MRTNRLPRSLSKGVVGCSVLETKSEQLLVLEPVEKPMPGIKSSFFFFTLIFFRKFGKRRAGVLSVKAK